MMLEIFKNIKKANHIKLQQEADEKSSGPASIAFFDPDGNTILIDQHV